MKYLRFLTLTLLLSVGFGLPSCTDECGCSPIEGAFFSIQNARLTNYQVIPGGDLKMAEEMDTLNMEEYLLEIRFETKYVSDLSHHETAPVSLINNAYACSCAYNGQSGVKEKVKSLKLVTLYDFDEQHLAGDTLNSFFELTQNESPGEPEAFFQQQFYEQQYFLKLLEKPATAEPLQLKLIIIFEDSRRIEAVSDAVVIQ